MYSFEEIENRMNQIPSELAEVIASKEVGDKLGEICKKYNTNTSQIAKIAFEMNSVLLGFTHPNEFPSKITLTGVGEDDAKNIAKEINEKIFSEIKDHLKELFNGQKAQEAQITEKYLKELEQKEESDISNEEYKEGLLEGKFKDLKQATSKKTNDYSSEKKTFDPYREPIE